MKDFLRTLASGLESGTEFLLDAAIAEQASELNSSARAALDRGDELEARRLWRRASSLDPTNSAASSGLASIERRRGDRVEPPVVMGHRSQALKLIRDAREAHLEGDDALAIETLRRAQAFACGHDELSEGIADTIAGLEARVRSASSPDPVAKEPELQPDLRRRVFVSYAREDRVWLDRLRPHLRAATLTLGEIVWDDTRIRPGDRWESEIERTLTEAEVAVLLLSVDYLASDFVRLRELPTLERRLHSGALRVVPVFVRESPVAHDHFLLRIQGANAPDHPVAGYPDSEVDRLFAELARGVAMFLRH